ncbi:SPFH domain-containing protein [Vibrio parahaemolyticus]|uniref:SPFH domain-containing protein n=1 Tax=Vibrio parahaemolyticus TaxID=670 RepID=A0AAW8Q7U7_VIBPH|nr:SPFH domain-containing protein [Vibrio parahaemolyticus]MDS1823791.1 SPFH domain-containing protein [Vibrio parahaemolyticus]
MMTTFSLVIGGIVLLAIMLGVRIVPQKQEYIVERLGKYHTTLSAGLNVIIPIVDRVAYKISLKEQTIPVPSQEAITKDNISVSVGGNVYLTITDSVKAAYNVDNWEFAVTQLSQTVMRSAIGGIELDETFSNRGVLNAKIVESISEHSAKWGVSVSMYELDEVEPPQSVKEAMERQMKSEREKRSAILEAQGKRESKILVAEGEKQAAVLDAQGRKESQILAAQALKEEKVLHAQGESEALIKLAEGQAESLNKVAEALNNAGGQQAMQFELAKGAIDAKKLLAKDSTVMLLSDKQADPSETVAQAMAVTTALSQDK